MSHAREREHHHRRGEGWIVFAAIMLGVAGGMWLFDAIWTFRYHGGAPGESRRCDLRARP